MSERRIRVRRAKNGRRAHIRHLYSVPSQRPAELREFIDRYGKRRGTYIYGATVGKVRREQAAKRPSGRLNERIGGYYYWRNGKRVHVRTHPAMVIGA